MKATEQHLIDMVNVCLSPVQPLRDDAASLLREAGFSYELIANLRWRDIRYLDADAPPLIATPDVDSILMSATLTAPLLAWKTVATERGWRKTSDLPVFLPFENGKPVTGRLAKPEEIRRDIRAHRIGELPRLSSRDIRVAAILTYSFYDGRPPTELVALRWRDLSRWAIDRSGSSWNLRLSLFHQIGEWATCWTLIVGRELNDDDSVWIPTRHTQVATDENGRILPLGKRAYWGVFTKRAAEAEHQTINANSFVQHWQREQPY